MALALPDDLFLDAVEHELDVLYPDGFRALLRAWRGGSVRVPAPPSASDGRFVKSREELVVLNAEIGDEQWGDLERAVGKKVHPKDGTKLWGGLLPFWFATSRRGRKSPLGRRTGDSVVGFDIGEPMSEKVLLWSVHTVVHEYPDVVAWLEDEGRPR